MKLDEILYSQGFGTRRICAGLIQQGWVQVCFPEDSGNFHTILDSNQELNPYALRFKIQGAEWQFHERAYLMLNKPAGFECSHKPSAWPSVYTLLPAPLRSRPNKNSIQGVQAIGRLDQDTTGLLLLSDDGQFIHQMTSPKKCTPKIYEVQTEHLLRPDMVEQLLAGVVLHDDPVPVRAHACERVDAQHLRLTLLEGKYHQVKRMVAAVGNRVQSLHRSQIGALQLPADLAPGQWRWLTPEEREALKRSS